MDYGGCARICFATVAGTVNRSLIATANNTSYPITISNNGAVLKLTGDVYSDVVCVRGSMSVMYDSYISQSRLSVQGVSGSTARNRIHTHVRAGDKYSNIEDSYSPVDGYVHTRFYERFISAQMDFTCIRTSLNANAYTQWRVFVTSGTAGGYNTGSYDMEVLAKDAKTIPTPYFSGSTDIMSTAIWSLELWKPRIL